MRGLGAWSSKKNLAKPANGQLISKGLFGILEFFQKTNEQILFSTVMLGKKNRIHSFIFWKNGQLERNITTLSDIYKKPSR